MAGLTIHVASGLSGVEAEEAREAGPAEVGSDVPIEELMVAAGFSEVRTEDVTAGFERVCGAYLDAWLDLETELRHSEGDEAFEDELAKKVRMMEGIRKGLLRRSLLLGVEAGGRPPELRRR